MHQNVVGLEGESAVTKYLISKGHAILEQNYECAIFGEIDIISTKGKTFYFVEVKTRKNDRYMDLTYTVDKRKLNAMKRAGEYYIAKERIPRDKYRFIIALVTLNLEKQEINFYDELNLDSTL